MPSFLLYITTKYFHAFTIYPIPFFVTIISACPARESFLRSLATFTVKTALGAEFTVDWKYVDNCVEAVDNLKKEGYTVYSVEQAEGSIMLDELSLDRTKKYAVVMGNEVKGVQQEVIDHSDGCIEIPQYGTKHSLNVSVTAGIVIWDLFKKLK